MVGRSVKLIFRIFLFFSFTLIVNASVFSGDATSADSQADEKQIPQLTRVEIGNKLQRTIKYEHSKEERILSVELVARFQHYNSRPEKKGDHYDNNVFSPKSVHFLSTGGKVYVNALEGQATIVYDSDKLEKLGLVKHRFRENDSPLFEPGQKAPFSFHSTEEDLSHVFFGKPVEFAESGKGRYLWVTYYRRSYDENASKPSAVAIIDSKTDKIVRVMPAGAIPKSITASPDDKWVAIINWGENSVGIINVSGEGPSQFYYEKLVEIEKRFVVKGDKHLNRDSSCGYCLRGAVFTPDSKYLIVGRMKGGGLAVIDMESMTYLGTVYGMQPTPRHLVVSPDGKLLYLSSNISGYVSSFLLSDIIDTVKRGKKSIKPLHEVRTGAGTRTIEVSPDGKFLFAAIKYESRVAVIRTDTMKLIMKVPTDSYPVGLDVSPDGSQLWVTAQGAKGFGGNSVSAYNLELSALH